MDPNGIFLESEELNTLRFNKQSAYNYRFRRYQDWTETYELYRDKVTINRLTQRQSVNVPLMKQTLKVIMKDIADPPVIYFENLDNDKQAEVFKNEYWKFTFDYNNMELQDIVDKKQELLFGRSFDQWQVVDGKIKMTVQDVNDIFVDRYCDPYNIHSSRFLIHAHIFKPLSTLSKNPEYDKEAVKKLEEWYATRHGLIKAADNQKMYVERQRKMADLGVLDAYSPILGETVVELSLHFVYRQEKDDDEQQLYLYVEADNLVILMKKKLEDIIGVTSDHFFRNHFPYVSWADDVERQDFYSDGMGDVVRTPNKILNTWMSQIVENKTLRNLSMHYYNASLEGFQPQTFQPIPWGWYPIPVPEGQKLDDVMKLVEVPELKDSIEEMNYLQQMSDSASGANMLQQGVPLPGRVQLGVAKMVLDQSLQRVKGISKFYTQAWKDRGTMFLKLVEAAGDRLDAVKIYKDGKNTKDIFSREIAPKDWMSKSGYRCKVWSQEEKFSEEQQDIQRLTQAVVNMPDNPKLNEIYKRKLLEFSGLDASEIVTIMEFEKQKQQAQLSMSGQPGMMPPQGSQPPTLPEPNQLPGLNQAQPQPALPVMNQPK